jgi:hypothetical protein
MENCTLALNVPLSLPTPFSLQAEWSKEWVGFGAEQMYPFPLGREAFREIWSSGV